MPMPMLIAKTYRMAATASAFHEKKNSAATAPTVKKDHKGCRHPVTSLTLCCAAEDGRRDRLRAFQRRLRSRHMRFFSGYRFNRTIEQFCWHILVFGSFAEMFPMNSTVTAEL